MTQTMERDSVAAAADRLQITVTATPDGSAHVTVSDEIDLHNAGDVRDALLAALTGSRGTVTVDFRQVTFCDCAGLNALLTAANTARKAHRSLRLTAVSRTAKRLFDLTGTRPYLT
ncbi:STAS domain-containing protein [Streptomyces sp. NPDC059533]|uniref:STAS domain-containing protein n=1 Tax=unclassified Streptomyces TaxID=2593676 RepID=UPI003685419D